MLDSDLVKLYQCKNGIKEIKQTVKNNPDKFPERYSFQLSDNKYNNLRSKFLTSSLENGYGCRRYNPYRFSECFLFCLYEKNLKNFGSKISNQNIKMWKYVKKVLSCRNKFKYFKYKKNYVIIYDSRVI